MVVNMEKFIDVIDKIASDLESKGLLTEAMDLDVVSNTLEAEARKKKEKKWIQKAVSEETEGDFTDWCKAHGHEGVCQECINKAAKAGGRPAKMANFAVNVSKGKYTYPETDKETESEASTESE